MYLGEHYVVDLLAGAALTGAVRRLGPRAGPALAGFGRAVAGAGGDRARGELMGAGESEPEMTSRDVTDGPARVSASHHEEEMPRVVVTRRQAIAFGVFVLAVVAFLYFVLPKLAGVGTTLHRIENGDAWWIAIGVVLELARSPAMSCCSGRCSSAGEPTRPGRSAGGRATRSRWPAWPPRACSRPPAPGASR